MFRIEKYVLINVIKKCKTDEYLHNYTFIKSTSNYLVITCEDDTVNTSSNSSEGKVTYKKNYYFLNTVSLSRHEQYFLVRRHFERYFCHHRATEMIMSRIFKGNMQAWTKTIKLTDKKKVHNLTN